MALAPIKHTEEAKKLHIDSPEDAKKFIPIAQVVQEALAAYNKSKGIYGDCRWEDCPLQTRDGLIHRVVDEYNTPSKPTNHQEQLFCAIVAALK